MKGKLKKALKSVGMLVLNIGLVIFALYLLRYLLVPAIIATAIVAFFNRSVGSGIDNMSDYFRSVAISVDQNGNVICGPLFNLMLINKNGYKFGNPDETISSVLGKNQVLNTLTFIGRGLNSLLSLIEKDHSIKSIEEDENNDVI